MLDIHIPAPVFTLPDQDGNTVKLSDFKGQKVVLYFYPKDNTPGCTKEACAFAAAYDGFKEQNVVVIGISKDSVRSHQKFADKFQLPFLILADPKLEAIQAYDVWKEKKLYGRTYMGITRSTYLIDEEGIIQRAYEKVDPTTHAQTILEDLKSI
ncbi:thioredoxin-dependent thiol peroxidase [Clostridiaceae bacterium DONG20-135]|uniref:thioredoxin-dependent peroxiredoxin n=1 Tax=Copranaerobaculum intestinale TaxID=2692629 RepID=A0A6N8UAS0_9FIRM|nr:thioredoxin-dependent thiol peroxidase [Copranaerobaculum intestinale]MXQ74434.1 thioredoxin-dependent thiol peroxidase [Copranaerobaculum intestinale]